MSPIDILLIELMLEFTHYLKNEKEKGLKYLLNFVSFN